MIIWPILWLSAIFAMIVSIIAVSVTEAKARRKAAEVVRQQQAALQQSQMAASGPMTSDDGMGGGEGFGNDMGFGNSQANFDVFEEMK